MTENPLILQYAMFPQRKYLTDRTEIWQCNIDTVQLIVMPIGSDLHVEVDKSKEAWHA